MINSMMPNASLGNPNMMFNGSWMNPILQAQNITGSINLKSTIFNSVASQVKVSLEHDGIYDDEPEHDGKSEYDEYDEGFFNG